MKKFLLAFLLLAAPVVALLPPAVQSRREMEAILTSPEISELIPSGDTIQQLLKVVGGYVIVTDKRIVPISIHYQKTKEIGPARFRLEFHEPISLSLKRSWREE